MKLSALVDFPDDAGIAVYNPQMIDSMIRQLSDAGISRMYIQYYGNREHGGEMDCETPGQHAENCKKTALNMPNFSRIFVETAKRYGMETAAVMRPQEQGIWPVYSPYYTDGIRSGVPHLGGQILTVTKFLNEHPDLRIKRRSWDIDSDAVNKSIGSIKLYKQNDVPTRIKKENITIYTSDDNSYYKPYEKDFSLTSSFETAEETVLLAGHSVDYENTKLLTLKGSRIQVLTLGNLEIKEPFVAIGVRCSGTCEETQRFVNTSVNGIACFDPEGNKICATPGGTQRGTRFGKPFLDAGFNFDDGFGVFSAQILDPDDKEGYIAIAKGKNEYVHGALCECEPAVREYWLSLLECALEDGYDFFGNRIENHAVHVDEPFAYGYNDCIKEEYFRRYGECSEQEMELDKIARIRGDAYTELFVEAARRVRARGKKVFLTLNIEMLQDPIPICRRIAYPMNVEWQWERWLEEIQPDEINFRMYQNTPKFLLTNPQCVHMLEVAKSYGVPMTVERYVYWDFMADYELLQNTGLFSRMTLYETANVLVGDENGNVVLTQKGEEVLPRLAEMIKKNE